MKTVRFGDAFHTEQATDMSYMFRQCVQLESVDTQNLDTSSVVDMQGMFDMLHRADGSLIISYEGNRQLTSLDLSTWDVSNVTDMSYMFYHCDYLKTVRCGDWDTSSVTDMTNMFYWCTKLNDLDISRWDTGSVKDFTYMFYECYALR
jgi:surface protein